MQGTGLTAACLAFIQEGQTGRFCGVRCTQQSDCPSGYDCTGVIQQCQTSGDCPPVPNVAITCETFTIENETDPTKFCTDPSGEPHEYFRSCAPSSGFCPPTEPP